MNVTGVKAPLIIQAIEDVSNEPVVQSHRIQSDQTVLFDYLDPKTYIIKVIEDVNDNGKWDTGNYEKGIQPERVFYFKKEIKVRSNWEVEDRIMIPANDTHEHRNTKLNQKHDHHNHDHNHNHNHNHNHDHHNHQH
jgi:hypothetical protein